MVLNIVLVVVIIITGRFISIYNKFIKLNNKVKQSESDIDVLLEQRFDLLPNLVETVKGYAKYESSTFAEITKLRSNYEVSDFSVKENNEIDNCFKKVMMVAEAYPDLKANTSFLSLQSSLKEIENKLNFARIKYNNRVTAFNNKVESIPSNIVAKIFNIRTKELFKIDENKRGNVNTNF